jgi:hypothetical protein
VSCVLSNLSTTHGTMLLLLACCYPRRVWDLDLDFVCRRTLLGHKDDVVHLDALGLNKAGPTTTTHIGEH